MITDAQSCLWGTTCSACNCSIRSKRCSKTRRVSPRRCSNHQHKSNAYRWHITCIFCASRGRSRKRDTVDCRLAYILSWWGYITGLRESTDLIFKVALHPRRPSHGVCLPTSSLAIGEDARIVSCQAILHNRLPGNCTHTPCCFNQVRMFPM